MQFRYILLTAIIFLSSCTQKDYLIKIDHNLVAKINHAPIEGQIHGKGLELIHLSGDHLPSGFDYTGEKLFYEIERIDVGNYQYLIHMLALNPGHKFVDIKMATLKNDSLLYNFPIWNYSENKQDYTLLKKRGINYFVEIYRDSKIIAKYFPETGIVE